MPHICKILLKDYCANCTFAGLRFIADDTKHWIERIFWVVLVVLSWYGSAVLIIAAWDAFVFYPISFGVETTYLEWNTEMPTVAVCEWENQVNAFKYIDKYWPADHNLDIEDALREILFFRGTCNSLVDNCYVENPDPICPMSNYTYYITLLRRKCPEIITNCSYNDKPFGCCDYFQPIDTDTGTCFILNSIQTMNPKPYLMITNMTQKRADIKFQTSAQAMVSKEYVITTYKYYVIMMYTLGPEELPTLTTFRTSTLRLQIGHNYSRHITVRNIENDPLVVQTTIEQRACRMDTENEGGLYPFYSYSGCIVECRRKAQMETCGCNDHFMPGTTESEHCDIFGLVCLNANKDLLTVLKPAWGKGSGLVCDCLPSCNEKEITVVRDVDRAQKKQRFSNVELALAYIPTERFKRNVVRSRLDLVVSVGGTAGLFVGASILSFVELIFFFTVRLGSNLMAIRKKRKLRKVVHFRPNTADIQEPLDIPVDIDPKQTAYLSSGINSSIPIYNTIQKNTMKSNLQKPKLTKLQVFRTKY